MGYNIKNYSTDGGDELVIGGTLTVEEGATVTGLTETTASASATALGGIKAATKGAGDTVECKIDGTSKKLYVPTYPILAAAATSALGGVMAADRAPATDTVEIKIGTDSKLYAPVYPVAANQADSLESTSPTVEEFNALLLKLKTAGLMTADS